MSRHNPFKKNKKSILPNLSTFQQRYNPIGACRHAVSHQVAIGIACASYWHGMWYMIDDNLFPDNPFYSAVTSLGLGTLGLAGTQGFIATMAKRDLKNKINVLPRHYTPFARFGALYCISTSCVLIWRGTWIIWDVGYEHYHRVYHNAEVKSTDPKHRTKSGIISHGAAVAVLLCVGGFASVLAPPARASLIKDCALKAKTWQDYSKTAKWFFK